MPAIFPLGQIEASLPWERFLPGPTDQAGRPVELSGFRGTLDQIGPPSLLVILEMERKTGILVMIADPGKEKAQLHLSEGRVIRARLDHAEEPRNAELVYRLLARTRGTFDFRPSGGILDDEVQCSTTQLILEGARRLDEVRLAQPSKDVTNAGFPADGPTVILDLVRAAQEGSVESYSKLVRYFHQTAWAIALAKAGDPGAAAAVLKEAWRLSYQEIRTLRSPDRFWPWFAKIVSRIFRNQVRGKRTERAAPPEVQPPGESSLQPSDRKNLILRAVARSGEEGHCLIIMRLMGRVSRSEIADTLRGRRADLPPRTVDGLG